MEMYDCPIGCPYRTYQHFYDYYGLYNYADQWITAAFTGSTTNFTRGNADLSTISLQGRSGTYSLDAW